MNKSKNIVLWQILIVIIMLVFLLLTISYAYFTIETTRSFTPVTNITKTPDIGIVTFQSKNNLSLSISQLEMMKKNTNVNYYATLDGTPSLEENNIKMGEIVLNGEGKMECSYTMNVTSNGNMYEAFKNMSNKGQNQIVLKVANQSYDFYNINLPLEITNTVTNLTSNNSIPIYASFKIVNIHNINQNALIDTNIKLSFTITNFSCHLIA